MQMTTMMNNENKLNENYIQSNVMLNEQTKPLTTTTMSHDVEVVTNNTNTSTTAFNTGGSMDSTTEDTKNEEKKADEQLDIALSYLSIMKDTEFEHSDTRIAMIGNVDSAKVL